MIRRDLIFRKSALVDDAECEEDGYETGREGVKEAGGWDTLLDDDPKNYEPDYDMDYYSCLQN
jgi:hypothetical protein